MRIAGHCHDIAVAHIHHDHGSAFHLLSEEFFADALHFQINRSDYVPPRSRLGENVLLRLRSIGFEEYIDPARRSPQIGVEGFFETMSIAENIYAGLLAAGHNKAWYISSKEIHDVAAEWSKKLNIRAINDNARVVELSGGNQQKVVIGKGLAQEPKLVIFDEPTRGVDVGAIAEIHQIINGLADQGLAVVVISSYLPEIMNLSDRILVCRQGRIVEEFSPAEATEEKIMYAAVH